MNILVATDSFRHSLSAAEAAHVIGLGIRDALPDSAVCLMPISDGGEGFLEVMLEAKGGDFVEADVVDPLGRNIRTEFGMLSDGKTAVVEMSKASGIGLLSEKEKNPLLCTTYGTGQLIKAALDEGCTRLLIGLGGSATIDGGIGMAQALGVNFFDADGRQAPFGGRGLADIRRIDISSLDGRIRRTEIVVACDVNVPFTGPVGAARVFGPQKGATPAVVADLDKWLIRYAELIRRFANTDVMGMPLAGASGGLAGGLSAFLGAKLEGGMDLVARVLELEEHIRGSDLVVTGEGTIDAGTLTGKAVSHITHLARRNDIPVVAIAGQIAADIDETDLGLDGMISACKRPMNSSEAIRLAEPLIRDAARRAALLVRLGQQLSGR